VVEAEQNHTRCICQVADVTEDFADKEMEANGEQNLSKDCGQKSIVIVCGDLLKRSPVNWREIADTENDLVAFYVGYRVHIMGA
jgi:hypothetical protein